jgi:hypothetical protein
MPRPEVRIYRNFKYRVSGFKDIHERYSELLTTVLQLVVIHLSYFSREPVNFVNSNIINIVDIGNFDLIMISLTREQCNIIADIAARATPERGTGKADYQI